MGTGFFDTFFIEKEPTLFYQSIYSYYNKIKNNIFTKEVKFLNTKNSLLKFQFISFFLTAIIGVLLHFTYELSGENSIVGIFSSINESTWEHLKLIFFPTLLSTILGYLYLGKNYSNYLCARTISTIISMIFTIVFFYTYTGMLGRNIAFVDISSFFISILIGEYVTYKLVKSDFKCNKTISTVILFFLFILFAIFTFNPPNIGLFEDPITGTYGINYYSLE